jgi:hypothetical protein
MKKINFIILLSYIFFSLFGTTSILFLNAGLVDIPDWLKPNVYSVYKAEDMDTGDFSTTKYTVLSVGDEIKIKVTNTGRGETSEDIMIYPDVNFFFTQSEIEKIKAGATTLDSFFSGRGVISYIGEETISVPAGSYQCYKFNYSREELGTIELWVDTDLGLWIKSIWRNNFGSIINGSLQETNIVFREPKGGIPGFPNESIIFGLLVSGLVIWILQRNK